MSVLEIVLYSILGSATAIYVTVSIIKLVRDRKHPEKRKKNEEED